MSKNDASVLSVVDGEVSAEKSGDSRYAGMLWKQGKQEIYAFLCPIDDLYPCCAVTTRDEDPEKGFQRMLDPRRAEDIAEYLNGDRTIPCNIVLSAQDAAEFDFDGKSKMVSFRRIAGGSFLVLDGQHRLAGFNKAAKRHRVLVTVYKDLSRQDEARYFMDINTKHKGVPPALLADIKNLANTESAKEGILRSIFDRLLTEKKHPMGALLSPAKNAPGKLSRLAFNRSLGPALASTTLAQTDEETRYRLVKNYFGAILEELPDGSKDHFTRTGFFAAACEVMDEVLHDSLTATKNAKQETLRAFVRPIAQYDYAADDGRVMTKKAILSVMQAAMRGEVTVGRDAV